MLQNQVGLSEYFDGHEDQSASELVKAMQAGHITGRDTTNLPLTGEPLKVESLESTLKVLEFKASEIKLFNAIPKLTAYNTVEEFLQLQSYGSERGGFYNEGELSDVEDSVYIRRSERVKYMQVTGEVTIQAQMTRSFINVMTQEVKNKMMWIMRLANRSLVKGDEDIIPQEFNSLYKQHAAIGSSTGSVYPTWDAYLKSGVVIDMRGKSLKQTDIEDAAVIVDDNHGSANNLYAPSKVLSAFSKDYYDKQRIIIDGKPVTGSVTDVPKAITTTVGNINLNPDKFMKNDPLRILTDPATSSKAPAAPVADGTTPVALVTDALTKYGTGEYGNVFYAVSSINRYGESALTVLDTDAITLAAGKAVDLKFTAGVGANAASGFVVYRTLVTTASVPTNEEFFPIFKLPAASLASGYHGAAAGIVRDRGYFLPNTEQCFLTEMDEEVMSFKQLAPMSKLDLAVLAMAKRFIVFQFGTPQLYAGKKFVRFINVANKYVA